MNEWTNEPINQSIVQKDGSIEYNSSNSLMHTPTLFNTEVTDDQSNTPNIIWRGLGVSAVGRLAIQEIYVCIAAGG